MQMGFRRSAARYAHGVRRRHLVGPGPPRGPPEYMGVDDPSVEEEAQRLEAAKRQAAAMRQAASTPVRTEDVYVLQTVDEASLRAALEVYSRNYHKPSPGRRRREERSSALGQKPRPAPRPRSARRRSGAGARTSATGPRGAASSRRRRRRRRRATTRGR